MERVVHVVSPKPGIMLRTLCDLGAGAKQWGYPDELAWWDVTPCPECMDVAMTMIARESVVEYMSAHDAILEGL